jgi:hypothetical protein
MRRNDMALEYVYHIAYKNIDGRNHLIAEPGYVITDGRKLYSRHLILAVGEPVPILSTITDEEYQLIQEQQNKIYTPEMGII